MTSDRTRQNLFTVFFMFAVTLVSISLVTAVQIATQGTVDRNRTLFLKRAVRDACGLPPPESAAALVAWYAANVEAAPTTDGLPDYFRVARLDAPDSHTLVVLERGAGLWGQITALVGFYPDAAAVKAVTFLEHNETPGLGARIDEPWFKRQFSGKSGPFGRLMPEPKDKDKPTADPRTIDQITGATITSTAVRDILNRSIARAKDMAAASKVIE